MQLRSLKRSKPNPVLAKRARIETASRRMFKMCRQGRSDKFGTFGLIRSRHIELPPKLNAHWMDAQTLVFRHPQQYGGPTQPVGSVTRMYLGQPPQ